MIRIRYQLRCEESDRHFDLHPEEYFDPLEPGESYSEHGVPRFDHAYQYTRHSPDELRWTVLEGGPMAGSILRTQFLDGRRSMMTHRSDADGYEEIIHSTEVGKGGLLIVRTVKMPRQSWSVCMSNYSIDNSIGEDKHVGWSSEERRAFCAIGIRT